MGGLFGGGGGGGAKGMLAPPLKLLVGLAPPALPPSPVPTPMYMAHEFEPFKLTQPLCRRKNGAKEKSIYRGTVDPRYLDFGYLE